MIKLQLTKYNYTVGTTEINACGDTTSCKKFKIILNSDSAQETTYVVVHINN